jgi:hypothetical protein
VKLVSSLFLCVILIVTASLALAGGPAQVSYPGAPCAGQQYAPAGNPCAYWGDAPFPGMCGGVVALPFLVVGSLLGGNTVGPCGPVPGPGYRTPPVMRAPQPCAAPVAPGYGAAYGPLGGSVLTGLPCIDICAGLLGSVTGGFGLGL